jgi:hypothetical protein
VQQQLSAAVAKGVAGSGATCGLHYYCSPAWRSAADGTAVAGAETEGNAGDALVAVSDSDSLSSIRKGKGTSCTNGKVALALHKPEQ